MAENQGTSLTIDQAADLGWQQIEARNFALAEQTFRHLLKLEPTCGSHWYYLGVACQAQGNLVDAERSYRQALRQLPGQVEVYVNLSAALKDLEKLDEAVACCRQALQLQPDLAEAYNNLSNVFLELGKFSEAEANARAALRLQPDYAEANYNLGNALAGQGRLAEAAASHARAVSLKPDFTQAHNNLGNVLGRQGNLDEAAASYRRTLQLLPHHEAARHSLGLILAEQGKLDEAIVHFEEALRLNPNPRLRIALATLLPPIYRSMSDLYRWRKRLVDNLRALREEHITLDLTNQPCSSLFYLTYQGLDDREIQRDYIRLFTPVVSEPLPAAAPRIDSDERHEIISPRPRFGGEGRGLASVLGPLTPNPSPPSTGERGDSLLTLDTRIHIGFVSSHLRNHTVGKLMLGVIANLKRTDFTVTVFPVGGHDDVIAREIKRHADRHVEVPAKLPAARRTIAEQGLDVLFYPDLGMDAFTYSLAFSRLAPVQCVTWGHPVSTGIDTIDYFISSEHLDTEDAQRYYTEKLVRLKNLAVSYHRPTLPTPLKDRGQFGLPGDRHLYACPQSPFKFHPEFDAILGGILRRDPLGMLILIRSSNAHWDEQLSQRFAHTIPDVVERIRFLPPLDLDSFWNLNAIVDVLLDPIHFGGGNTSYEGLAFGTPIVTLPSAFLRGRITYALYRKMDVLDCVVADAEEYIDRAIKLGIDRAYRDSIRRKILAANSVLYENLDGIRELETFFKQALARSRSGAIPLQEAVHV